MAVTAIGSPSVQSGSTSVVVTGVPTTPLVDDILLMVVYHKGAGTPSGPTAAGWTLLDNLSTGSGSLWVYYRFVTVAGTQADVTVTGLTSSSLGSMACFRGVHTTTPFINHSGSVATKGQTNAEGTYEIGFGGNSFSMIDGAMAIAVMGLDNDATFTGFWSFQDTSGGVAEGASGITQGNTVTGTDCTLGWGKSSTLHGGEIWSGFNQTITEGSAGTASNAAMMFVLNPTAAAAPSSLPYPYTQQRYALNLLVR